MRRKSFFAKPSERNNRKTLIVSEYFQEWAFVTLGPASKPRYSRIGYVELFSGPGEYGDGSPTTPMTIAQIALTNERIQSSLIMRLNDEDNVAFEHLQPLVDKVPFSELAFSPWISNASASLSLLEAFWQKYPIPTLTFLDPFGYRGVTLAMVEEAISGRGCDSIIFFNFERLYAAANHPSDKIGDHVNAFFGEARANQLRANFRDSDTNRRRELVQNAFREALESIGAVNPVAFEFSRGASPHPGQYVVLASKHELASKLMLGVMKRHSSDPNQVKRLEFRPQLRLLDDQDEVFSPSGAQAHLLRECAGRTVTAEQVYRQFHGGVYDESALRAAILDLEGQGEIVVSPDATKRPLRLGKPTLAYWTIVSFPSVDNSHVS